MQEKNDSASTLANMSPNAFLALAAATGVLAVTCAILAIFGVFVWHSFWSALAGVLGFLAFGFLALCGVVGEGMAKDAREKEARRGRD